MNSEEDVIYECKMCKKRYRHLVLRNGSSTRKHSKQVPHDIRTRSKSTSPIRKWKVDYTVNLEPTVKTFLCETCLDPFYCQVCGEAFSAKSSLYKHVSFHNANNPSCCGICGKEFDGDRDCALHWRHHAKANELYTCYLCLKKFENQSDIYKHLLQNCEHLSLRCFVCQESFESRQNVVSHMRVHKEFEVFEKNCFDGDSRPENLQMHNIIFPCPHCTEYFSTKIDFNEHLKNHKSHKMNPVVILTDINKTGILKHALLNITLKDEALSEEDGLKFFGRSNIFSDIELDITKKNNGKNSQHQYMRKKEIRNHMKKCIEAPYKCDICERLFTLKCNLANHMSRHTISEHFNCMLCSKTFTSEEFLYKPKFNQREIPSDLPESNLQVREKTASPSVQEQDTLKLAKIYMPEIEFSEVSVNLVDILSKRNVLKLRKKNKTKRKQFSTKPQKYDITLPNIHLKRICSSNFNADKHISSDRIPHKCGITRKFFKSGYSKSRCRSEHTSVQYFYCETCATIFTDEDDYHSHKGGHTETCSDSPEFGSRKEVRIFKRQKNTSSHLKKTKIYKRNLVDANSKKDVSFQMNKSEPPEKNESQRNKDLKKSNLNTLSSEFTEPIPGRSEPSENRKILRIHKCDTCGKCFGMKPHLYRHMGQHCYNPFFYCNLCRKGFTDVDRFHLHVTTHRGNLVSRELNRKVNMNSVAVNNQDNCMHTGKRRVHRCDACDGGFNTVPTLFQHIEKHTSSSFFYCNICRRGFINPGKIYDHGPSHKKSLYDTEQNHVVDEQSVAVDNQVNAVTSISSVNIPGNNVNSIDSRRIHKCDTCGRGFVLKSHLFRHMAQHNCGPYTYCKHCKKGFTNADKFQSHENSHMEGLIDLEHNLTVKRSSNQVCNQEENESDTRTSNISTVDEMTTSPDKFLGSTGQSSLETSYKHTETDLDLHNQIEYAHGDTKNESNKKSQNRDNEVGSEKDQDENRDIYTHEDTEVECEKEDQNEDSDVSLIKSVVKRYVCNFCNKKFTHSWNYRSHILLDHASMHMYLKSSSQDKIPVTITILDDMHESKKNFTEKSSLLSKETTQNSNEHISVPMPSKENLKRKHPTDVEAELDLDMFRNLLSGKRPVVVLEDISYVNNTKNKGDKKPVCRKRVMPELIERVEANLAEGVSQSSLCEIYKIISDSQLNIPLEPNSLTLPHLRHQPPSKEMLSIAQVEEKILSMCENTVVDNWMKENYQKKQKKTDQRVCSPAILESTRRRLAQGVSKRRIAKDLGISESTHRQRLKKGFDVKQGRLKPTFSAQQEEELPGYGSGHTSKDAPSAVAETPINEETSTSTLNFSQVTDEASTSSVAETHITGKNATLGTYAQSNKEVPTSGVADINTNEETFSSGTPSTSVRQHDTLILRGKPQVFSRQITKPVFPEHIRPFPKRKDLQHRRKRSQKSAIIASLPDKDRLGDKANEKIITLSMKTKSKENTKYTRRKQYSADDTSRINPKKKKKDGYKCPFCGEMYTEPLFEDWIMCKKCNEWWHEKCSGYEGSDDFICDNC